MKLTIDDVAKTIQIEGCDSLGDVMYKIKRMFPDGEWMEYQLIPTIVVQKEWIYTNGPNLGITTIPYIPQQSYQPDWIGPVITGSTGTVSDLVVNGTNGTITCENGDTLLVSSSSQVSDLVTFTAN